VPDAALAFTIHRRSGQGALVAALLMLIGIEGAALHLLLRRISAPLAWVLTLGSVYAAGWLIADLRASRLRPILLEADTLRLRSGLRLALDAPRSAIERVTRERPFPGREALNGTFFGRPTHWIVFREPLEVRGPFGLKRPARAVGVQVDDPEAFTRALTAVIQPGRVVSAEVP
jgi:hypothetical protein